MEKTIELNGQEVNFLKDILEEMADNYKNTYSKTYEAIARGIVSKLEE